jgi:D-alanyl-D-alanine-carboxypeptidase/D-alanyl-D-alanine-endopeptidase
VKAIASTILAVAATAVTLLAQSNGAAAPVAPNADIRKILVERIDVQKQSVGIVVGILEPGGRRIVTYGSRAAGDTHPLDGQTVFEIGSITKVFTALLLADAVQRGEVALTDPVAKYLPAGVKMPERGARPITLQDLAMHVSGLPRLPSNIAGKDPANPYADYSTAQMYEFLSAHQLRRDVGVEYEYSNFGAGLLGHVLARRAGTDYETLVRTRITGPLGMKHTGITLSPEMQARLAPGHSPGLERVKNWDLPTLAGAGALRSNADDLLTFLAAATGYKHSPLDKALATMLSTRRPTNNASLEMALGWHVLKDERAQGTEIVWHNGGTGGYRTWMGYEPKSRTGVVVLSNAGTAAGPDDIGRHLLVPALPLMQSSKPSPTRTETKVEANVFDRYVGRYQLAPSAILTISRNGSQFFVQLTGQPTFEIFAESEKKYFLKVVDAQLTFETDAQNKAVAVTLHQNGIDQRAPRIEGEPVMPKEVTLDPAVLERYVGEYELAPGAKFTVTRKDNQLFVQLTGQPSFEVFASGERDFFYKVVNAQLTFEVEGQGSATAVVLHQNGKHPRAPRIKQ